MNISELLRESDPLRHEPTESLGQRDRRRQAILAAASGAHLPAWAESRSRLAVLAGVILLTIAASLLGWRVRSPLVSDLQAAVRFEIRLAEDGPAPGLSEAKVADSGRSIYLHDEIIVTNADIAAARVVQASGASQYSVDVKFNASGTNKMRAATANHIGKPVAILIDGRVVMAPLLRTPIAASAIVSGNFTKAQAQKIVNGIGLQR